MFQLKEYSSHIRIVHTTVQCGITIYPDNGGTITELIFPNWGNILKVPQSWNLKDGYGYESAWLAPYPNRTAAGNFSFNNMDYQLPLDGVDPYNAIHGFVFNQPFKLEEIELYDSSAICKLSYQYSGDYLGYPFPFILHLKIQISLTTGFAVELSMENTGDTSLPCGLGWHPYFDLQMKINELMLKLPVNKKYSVNEQMIPTGKLDDFTDFIELSPIGNTELDDCFPVHQDSENGPETILKHPEKGHLCFWTDHPYDFLQVYTPPDRNSIAIEPMTCAPDALNNGLGLKTIESGHIFQSKFYIQHENS